MGGIRTQGDSDIQKRGVKGQGSKSPKAYHLEPEWSIDPLTTLLTWKGWTGHLYRAKMVYLFRLPWIWAFLSIWLQLGNMWLLGYDMFGPFRVILFLEWMHLWGYDGTFSTLASKILGLPTPTDACPNPPTPKRAPGGQSGQLCKLTLKICKFYSDVENIYFDWSQDESRKKQGFLSLGCW